MSIAPEEIVKLLLAVVVGGAIGLEREVHHKAAGFRTITLICLGSALFTILSIQLEGAGRIAASIVTGIGFLGAGVILHETNHVTGLTTAATIWLSAALGMGIGAGDYYLAFAAAILALIVVRIFVLLERGIGELWEVRQYEITLPGNDLKVDQLVTHYESCGLQGHLIQKMKQQGRVVCIFTISGSTKKQNCFVEKIIADPEITNFLW